MWPDIIKQIFVLVKRLSKGTLRGDEMGKRHDLKLPVENLWTFRSDGRCMPLAFRGLSRGKYGNTFIAAWYTQRRAYIHRLPQCYESS